MVGLPYLLRFPPVMKHSNTRRTRSCRRIRTVTMLAVVFMVLAGAAPVPVSAQYPDTYILGRGVLRMSFEPSYRDWRHRFDEDGNVEPLGADLSFDSTAGNFFPTMTPVERAIWSITGDSSLGITAGAFQTELDADVRRFPFKFRLGLLDRLTLTASIPIVTTRMQVDFQVDSSANVGWNTLSPISGLEASAVPQLMDLLAQIEASAASLEATINSGGLDCPNGPQCDNARALVSRARTLANDLVALTGMNANGETSGWLPPFAPLETSAAGQALAAAIQDISTQLQNLGAPAVTETVPFPINAVSPDSIQNVLTETTAGFGYDAEPLAFAKYKEVLGDLEVGLRLGLLQGQSIRAVLSSTVRLPTGRRASPDHYVNIGTGDRQLDVETGLEMALEPGKVVGLAVAARYNLQLGDELVRRLSPPHQPIALAAAKQTVSRNLGDVISISAFPTLRLDRSFRAFTSIHYYHKGADSYSGGEFSAPGLTTVTASDLGVGTEMRALSLGAGIHFRSSGREGITKLPAEAGIHYYATYQGSGGLTPKAMGVRFYLRLFRRVFGGGDAEEPPPDTTEPSVATP